MLNNTPFMTTLPATDIKRVKNFYENQLGLKTIESKDGMLVLSAGNGGLITIYEREAPTKADHTVLTFEVKKIESEIQDLKKRGVKFEDYDMPDIKTVNHVAVKGNDKAAWFKDTEGNIICIHETVMK